MSHRNFSKKSRNGKHRNPRVESPEFPRTGHPPRFPAHGGHEPSYYGPPNGWTQRDQGHFGFNQEVGQNSPFRTPSDFQRGRNPQIQLFPSPNISGSTLNPFSFSGVQGISPTVSNQEVQRSEFSGQPNFQLLVPNSTPIPNPTMSSCLV